MIRLSFLIMCGFLSAFSQIPSPKDWRGLSPIKSTWMDVERTLGPPAEKIDHEQMTYYYPDVVVYFHFTSNPKCGQKLPYTSWDVASDTLTAIDVTLRRPPAVEETGVDLTKFKKIKGAADMINNYYYVSADDDGFAVDVGNDHIGGYHYAPGSKHKTLRCEPTNQP